MRLLRFSFNGNEDYLNNNPANNMPEELFKDVQSFFLEMSDSLYIDGYYENFYDELPIINIFNEFLKELPSLSELIFEIQKPNDNEKLKEYLSSKIYEKCGDLSNLLMMLASNIVRE